MSEGGRWDFYCPAASKGKQADMSSSETVSFADAFAHTMRMARKRAGLSQRQLAARMSCERTYISKIENGGALPTIPSLRRFADALELTSGQILAKAESLERP